MTYKELGFEKTALSSELYIRAAAAALKKGDLDRFDLFSNAAIKAAKKVTDKEFAELNLHNDPAMIKHVENVTKRTSKLF